MGNVISRNAGIDCIRDAAAKTVVKAKALVERSSPWPRRAWRRCLQHLTIWNRDWVKHVQPMTG